MLIDCHVHLNNYTESKVRPLEESVGDLVRPMDENGIVHAVVLTSYVVSVHRPRVEQLLDLVGNDPRISVVEGLRWRGNERTDLFNMEERIRSGVVRGIKLYPGYDRYAINDPSLESFFLLAAKYDVPVMIHTGDTYAKHAKVRQAHPLLVDDVAVDFPDVNFVMCHLGNPWFDDAAEVRQRVRGHLGAHVGRLLGRVRTAHAGTVAREDPLHGRSVTAVDVGQ